MEGRRSFVSSRSFASDLRAVPNIVALYERPRQKIRRDATHVLGGMFGWNTPDETERALRVESSRGEEEATATPDSAAPADSTLAGPSQRCIKKPLKRPKRRGFAPLIDMGASILSMHFQELLRRQHQPEEKEISTPISAPAKRPIDSAADTIISPAASSTSNKARVSGATGDPPVKRLRLTLNSIHPIDTSLSIIQPLSQPQMPLSPPDTSSNASKAPVEHSALGTVSTSTPKGSLPILPDFDATLNFDLEPLDSESESESSSESSSDLESDSPDLSSSTSTRSTTQNKGKDKDNAAQSRKNTHSVSPGPLHDLAYTPEPQPSTPQKRKRQARKPGWVGWVQTEESPDHSRLIRLDDAPVILGRRTRSGKEFQDPPPLPPSRRKPPSGQQTPNQPAQPVQLPQRPKPNRKPSRKSHAPSSGKSKRQIAWQEAQKRAAPESDADVTGGNTTLVAQKNNARTQGLKIVTAISRKSALKQTDGELLAVAPSENQSTARASSSSMSQPTPALASAREVGSSSQKNAPTGSVSSVSLVTEISTVPPAPAPILKLTRSDAVITPTFSRPDDPNEKEQTVKDSISGQKKSASPTKIVLARAYTNGPDARETVSRTSPSVPKAASAISKNPATSAPKELIAPPKTLFEALAAKKPLTATKNDATKSFSIELKKSRNPAIKPPPFSKFGSAQNQSGWASDASAGEVAVMAKVARLRAGSPSPPEKAKRPVPTTSADANPTPSSSVAKPVETTKSKPADSSAGPLITKPSASMNRRENFFTKLGKKAEPSVGPSVLGKRKDHVPQASSSHFKKRKLSRKLVISSSSEDEAPSRSPKGFHINPFERRAKQMELTRKGVNGDAYKHEMDKWVEAKRAGWKTDKEKKRESEKSGSDGKASGSFARPAKPTDVISGAITDSTAKSTKDSTKASRETISTISRDGPKIGDLPRVPKAVRDSAQSDHAGHSPKAQKLSSKLVWNGDWGMDIPKVSVTGSAGDAKNKAKKFLYRRGSDAAGAADRTKDQPSAQSSTNPNVGRARA